MCFAIANAALHDVAIPILWVGMPAATLTAFSFAFATAAIISAATSARGAFDVSADTAGSFGNCPSPHAFVLTVGPVDGLNLFAGR